MRPRLGRRSRSPIPATTATCQTRRRDQPARSRTSRLAAPRPRRPCKFGFEAARRLLLAPPLTIASSASSRRSTGVNPRSALSLGPAPAWIVRMPKPPARIHRAVHPQPRPHAAQLGIAVVSLGTDEAVLALPFKPEAGRTIGEVGGPMGGRDRRPDRHGPRSPRPGPTDEIPEKPGRARRSRSRSTFRPPPRAAGGTCGARGGAAAKSRPDGSASARGIGERFPPVTVIAPWGSPLTGFG